MMERIERRSEQLDEQLLERQSQLQREVTLAYAELARSVGTSLQQNLAASTQATGETIRPIVQSAMAQLVQEAQGLQQRLGEVAQAQVDALSRQFTAAEQQRLQAWTEALEQRATQVAERAGSQAERALAQVSQVLAQSGELVQSRAQAESRWLREHGERMDALASTWRTELAALRQEESQRGDAAAQRLGELQASTARHLAELRHEESQRGDAAVQRMGELQTTVAEHLAALREEEAGARRLRSRGCRSCRPRSRSTWARWAPRWRRRSRGCCTPRPRCRRRRPG